MGTYAAAINLGGAAGDKAAVTNGSVRQFAASIEGVTYGIDVSGQAGSITNFGLVSAANIGMLLEAGGTVTNGSSVVATGALVRGSIVGIDVGGQSGLVQNYGVVSVGGSSGIGVLLQAAGHVVNGSTAVTNASIVAYGVGVQVGGGFSTVGNDGTITAPGTAGIGVLATAGGKVNNGFYGVTSALISGTQFGVSVSNGSPSVINSGTITGAVGVAFGTAVPSATLTNTGTITGTGGIAATFASGNDVVSIGAGAVFKGAVIASATGANVLQLMNGPAAGSVSGIGSQFQHFPNLNVLAGAQWSLAGTNTGGTKFGIQLGSGSKLTDKGKLAVGSALGLTGPGTLSIASTGQVVVGQAGTGALGTFTVDAAHGTATAGTLTGSGTIVGNVSDGGTIDASGGTLTLNGSVSGTGTVAITAHAVLDAGQSLSTSHLVFLSGGSEALLLGKPASVSSVISGFVAGDRIDLLGEAAKGLSYSTATHTLTVSSASGSLAHLHFGGNYTAASFHLATDGHGGTNITVR